MKTSEYCAALKRRLKITSDYGLAKRLGISKQRVSNYVNGERVFDNTMAARVAELLELEPMRVIADCELERGSSQELWMRIRAAAAWTAIAIGAASFGVAPQPAEARFNNNVFAVNSPVAPAPVSPASQGDVSTHCAASRRRSWRRVLGALLGLALSWILGGCTTMGAHPYQPPADWPALAIAEHIGIGDTLAHCYRYVPPWMKALGGVPLGCAVVNFSRSTCDIYMAVDSDGIREHEREHCAGFEHDDDSLAQLWTRHKTHAGLPPLDEAPR